MTTAMGVRCPVQHGAGERGQQQPASSARRHQDGCESRLGGEERREYAADQCERQGNGGKVAEIDGRRASLIVNSIC